MADGDAGVDPREQVEGGRQVAVYKLFEPGNFPAQSPRAVASQAAEVEDDFASYYIGQHRGRNLGIIQPKVDPSTLQRRVNENNALSPCIEAMVTNVDGTGFEFVVDVDESERKDPTAEQRRVISELWDFFGEPYPGESFVTQRKELRRDIKSTGNGYLEVVRSAGGDITFTKVAPSRMMRLVQLDEPKATPLTVKRKGAEVTINTMVRWRRFVQYVRGQPMIWFKEFGCPLDLDKRTGKWAPRGTRLGATQRANEIIHFIDLPDDSSPYGLPSWYGQTPSVLGSRKAEEFNLTYFDNGGMPPVMIFLQGGMLSTETRRAIEQRAVAGSAASKNRIVVIEMEPVGSMDHPTSSKVVVERFGSEQAKDALFDKYDDKCEIRIRRGFRLPPMFVGATATYSFASAYTSYTVAEAQVFKPERDEFDEIVSIKLLPAMGYRGYRMRSKPLVITDITLVLSGLEIAAGTDRVPAKALVDEINKAVGTNMQVEVKPQNLGPQPQGARLATNANGTRQSNSTQKRPTSTPVRAPALSKEDPEELARGFVEALQKNDSDGFAEHLQRALGMSPEDVGEFASMASDLGVTLRIGDTMSRVEEVGEEEVETV